MASAGKRTRLVTIQQMTPSKGGTGRPVETWTTLTQAWMEREDIDLRTDISEHIAANQRSARSDVTWRMPFQASMDPEAIDVPRVRRLVYKGRIYDIVAAIPKGRDIEMTTMAKAG